MARKNFIVAADRNDRKLGVIGVFTNFSKAIKACEDYHASTYQGKPELNWSVAYDGDKVDYYEGRDSEGYDCEYLCWRCYLDMNFSATDS